MKNIITLVITLFISILSFAQTAGINYKAVIKDDNGTIMANQNLKIKFSILTLSDNVEYSETHTTTTDANGIVIVLIGTGTEAIIGDFYTIDWSSLYKLKTEIDTEPYDSFVPLGITSFQFVPYALHASTAENVFSGDYDDLSNQPTITSPTGLAQITEVNPVTGFTGTGWRLIGNNIGYGPIGNYAVDLSYASSLQPYGVTGRWSTAMGRSTFASGEKSTAMGDATLASGISSTAMGLGTIASENYSTAMGRRTEASGFNSTAMGNSTLASGYSSTTMGTSTIASNNNSLAVGAYNADLPTALFMIGNGANGFPEDIRSNALTVYQNGNTTIGGSLIIQNVSDDTSSWQFETRPNGSLSMYRNGDYRGFFNESTVVYSSISDRKTKRDITPLDNGTLNKVMQLNPVSYLMKDQTDAKRNLGLISQEVQEVFPTLTTYVEESDLITLSYTELIPILIKALQEQQAIIEAQKAKDIVQDKSIEELVLRLNLIESESTH